MSLLPIQPTDRPIKEEIVELAGALADTQAKLFQLAERLENDDSDEEWRVRYEEIKDAHKEAVNGAKWLRAQNVDLQHRLDQQKPEFDNAITARDMALQKLKHARKVIRDLLAERPDMSSPGSSRGGPLSQRDIEEALGEDFNRSDSSSSDSDQTVRIGANVLSTLSHSQEELVHSPSSRSPSSSRNSTTRSQGSPARSMSSINSLHSKSGILLPRFGHSESFSSSMHLLSRAESDSPTSSRVSPEPLHLHFKNPPGVSILQDGPIDWQRLEILLKLDEDMVNSLSSIASSPDVSMRLQMIVQPRNKEIVACLYDPILVDTPGKSYLLDWGRSQANRNLEKYIYKHKAIKTTFHTFLFPPSEEKWFYVGALQWTRVHMTTNFWAGMNEKNKKRIVKKLCKRTKGEVFEDEMTRLLDNGDLQQLCIELTASGDGQASYDFATEVLGRQGSPYSPPRRERRAEGVKE